VSTASLKSGLYSLCQVENRKHNQKQSTHNDLQRSDQVEQHFVVHFASPNRSSRSSQNISPNRRKQYTSTFESDDSMLFTM